MKIAILSDIHGNLDALDAVLADIEAQGAEEIWNLGDLVGYCAHPKECIAKARKLFKINIMGNHDGCSVDETARCRFPMSWMAAEGVRYAIEKLDEEEKKFLKELPLTKDLPDFGVLLSHASRYMPEYWNYIFDRYDARGEFGYLNLCKKPWKISFVGHTHSPMIYVFENNNITLADKDSVLDILPEKKYIINIGSVGQPRDNNPKSCYVILNIEENKMSLSFRRVKYDVDKACAAIIDSGLSSRIGLRLKVGE